MTAKKILKNHRTTFLCMRNLRYYMSCTMLVTQWYLCTQNIFHRTQNYAI